MVDPILLCEICKHVTVFEKRQCAAFPDGIPTEIWEMKVLHRKPYPGDHGIQFAAVEGITAKGGPGSGNWGHEGRPGEVGGSGPGGGEKPEAAALPTAEDLAAEAGYDAGYDSYAEGQAAATDTFNGMSESEKAAIDGWMNKDSYSALNGFLRDGTLDWNGPADQQARVDAFAEPLEKLPEYNGASYRGVHAFPADSRPFTKEAEPLWTELTNLKPDDVYSDKAFTSATADEAKTDLFLSGNPKSNFLFQIQSGETKPHILPDILVYKEKEDEVVFQHGTSFRILSNELQKDGSRLIKAVPISL
jgi:hypothetical protein